jgi:hypothetical protein
LSQNNNLINKVVDMWKAPYTLNSACSASQWPNNFFCNVIRWTIVSFSTNYDACYQYDGLSLIGFRSSCQKNARLFFFFCYFNFSPYSFDFYFFLPFYRIFICLQFDHLILIWHIIFIQFNLYCLDFWIFFLAFSWRNFYFQFSS